MSNPPANRRLLWLAVILGAVTLVYQGWEMALEDGEPILQGHDDTGYFLWLHSWVTDGDNNLANNLALLPTTSEEVKGQWLEQIHPSSGKVLNKYPIGWALYNWLPYKVTYVIHNQFSENASGLEPVYFLVIWINQLFLAALSLILSYRILRRFLKRESSQWALMVTWLSSPLVYYQTARLGMAHNQAFFFLTLVIWTSMRIRKNSNGSWWLLLGIAAGMLLVTRPTSVCYLIIPSWIAFQLLKKQPYKELPNLLMALLAAGLPLFIQFWVWKDVYGAWLVFSYYGEPFYFMSPAILESLFSDRHGLFNWHPFLLVGATGWLLGTFRRRVFPITWFLSFAAILYLNSAWWCWWFGSSFGNRGYEGSMLFFMAGLGYLFERLDEKKIGSTYLKYAAHLAIAWNIYLLFLYLTHRIDRSSAISYLERISGWF